MTATELEPLVKVQDSRIETLQKQIDELKATQKDSERKIQEMNVMLAKAQQQLVDHIAHVEKWDTRRWALLAAIVGGLAVNIVMLFINRK